MFQAAAEYPSQPHPSNSDQFRQLRREVRRAGSVFLDAAQVLDGRDYLIAVKLSEVSDWLLTRLDRAERRAI